MGEAEVDLPNQKAEKAYVKGGSMIVEISAKNAADVTVWCLDGTCRLENAKGDSKTLSAGQKRLYHSDKEVSEDSAINNDAEWQWDQQCNLCIGVFPTPTPTPNGYVATTPTNTPRPQPTATIIPPTAEATNPKPVKTAGPPPP
jgi:hypothetical protein